MITFDPSERQEAIDRFYWSHGPCCAGCDWWRHFNSLVGECLKSAPVSALERMAMIGGMGFSINIGAGHIMTKRDHHCGDFKDDFNWSTLSLTYRRRVGARP